MNNTRIAVSDKELAKMMDVCINTARKFAEESGAVVRIGKRRLNNLELIQKHLNEVSESQ